MKTCLSKKMKYYFHLLHLIKLYPNTKSFEWILLPK